MSRSVRTIKRLVRQRRIVNLQASSMLVYSPPRATIGIHTGIRGIAGYVREHDLVQPRRAVQRHHEHVVGFQRVRQSDFEAARGIRATHPWSKLTGPERPVDVYNLVLQAEVSV